MFSKFVYNNFDFQENKFQSQIKMNNENKG